MLTISRLEDRYKGHDVVLRALPLVRVEVPDVRWHVIGDGPLRHALEERARTMDLGECVAVPRVGQRRRARSRAATADAFCMVSRMPTGGFAGEGFGIVYLEANAHGLPVWRRNRRRAGRSRSRARPVYLSTQKTTSPWRTRWYEFSRTGPSRSASVAADEPVPRA